MIAGLPSDSPVDARPGPIVFFDFFYTFGGAQRSTATLINWLSKHADRRVIFLSPSAPHPSFAELVEPNLILLSPGRETPLARARASKWRFLIAFAGLLISFASWLRSAELKTASFVTSSRKGILALTVLKLMRFGRLDIVYYARGEADPGHFSTMECAALRYAFRRVLCVSAATRGNLLRLGIPLSKSRVVYTSVDVSILLQRACAMPDLKKSPVEIAFVGSVIPTKGLHHLIGAISRMREPSRCRLRIVGGAPNETHAAYYAKLREDTANWGSSRIQWCGWVPHAQDILADSDVLCLPSYTEGMPRVLIEAMSLGRIVLASAVGGVPELINDGINGFIIPLDDTGISAVIENAIERANSAVISDRARATIAEKFALDVQGRLVLNALA